MSPPTWHTGTWIALFHLHCLDYRQTQIRCVVLGCLTRHTSLTPLHCTLSTPPYHYTNFQVTLPLQDQHDSFDIMVWTHNFHHPPRNTISHNHPSLTTRQKINTNHLCSTSNVTTINHHFENQERICKSLENAPQRK